MRRKALWIILASALCVRLIHIDFPVGGFAGWRQADTAAMARNYYENGYQLLRPQIDWGGNSAGYVESEFPLYQFAAALLYGTFGPADTLGRLLSILSGLLTILGVFLIARLYLGERVALWAAAVYAFLPLNVFYSRAFMIESTMLMFSVYGVYGFAQWVETQRPRFLVLSAVCVALAVLLKIVALYLAVPLFYLAWTKFRKHTLARPVLYVYAASVLLPVVLWYYHAHQTYLESGLTFGIWMFGSDKWGMGAPLLTIKWYNDVFFKSIAERHLTYAGCVPFLIGLFQKRSSAGERVFDLWIVGIFIYFAGVAVGNQVHEYYQLPIAIPASIFIGKAFQRYLDPSRFRNEWMSSRLRTVLLVLSLLGLAVLSALRLSSYFRGEDRQSPLFQLGDAVQRQVPKGSLIIAVNEGNPVVLYRCDRKGWHGYPDRITPDEIDGRAAEGAAYVVGERWRFRGEERERRLSTLIGRYPVVESTDAYFILRTR